MTKEEVTRVLLTEFAPNLPGFKSRKRESDFVRHFPGGRQRIAFAIVDQRPEFKVAPVFSFRLDAAEEILHAVLGTPPQYRKMTTTTVTRLDYFFPGHEYVEYSIATPGEIAEVARELAPHLRDRIVPFLDAHRDLGSIEGAVNPEDGPSWDQTSPPYHQMSSLILARLADNPRFESLVERCLREADEWDPADQARLRELVDRLRNRAP